MTKKHHRTQNPSAEKPTESEPTWRDLVRAVFARQEGGAALSLSQLYDALGDTAKARKNPTYQATIRRTLQQDETLEPAGVRGTWKLKGSR